MSTITAMIARLSRGEPLALASAAAAASSSASGCVTWPASSPGQRRPLRRTSSFGPDTSSRRAASRCPGRRGTPAGPGVASRPVPADQEVPASGLVWAAACRPWLGHARPAPSSDLPMVGAPDITLAGGYAAARESNSRESQALILHRDGTLVPRHAARAVMQWARCANGRPLLTCPPPTRLTIIGPAA